MNKSEEYISECFFAKHEIIERNILFSYSGSFVHEDMLSTLYQVFNEFKTKERSKFNMRFFFILGEFLQNMSRYHYVNSPNKIKIACSNDELFILTDNYSTESIYLLAWKIDYINTRNATELKNLFFDKLKQGTLSDKIGNAIGLTQIVRKSGRTIDYSLKKESDEISHIILIIRIPLNLE